MEADVRVGCLSGSEASPGHGAQGGAERSRGIVEFPSRQVRLGLDPHL